MTDSYRVLIVCTGNVCRSPMAEGFLAALVREQNLDHVVVTSAGTHALEGCTPTNLAIEAASDFGADIQGYRASYLDGEKVKNADLILVMEQAHVEIILKSWPKESDGKVRLMRSFHPNAPSQENVTDPMGATLAFYRNTAHQLMACCYGVIRYLKEQVKP